MIPPDQIQAVRERVPIEEVIQAHVRLKRAGASLRGLCPFHAEKTPSFYVHPDRGFFHCFGCGASGDVFTFVMQLEGRSFVDVVTELANRSGVEITNTSADPAAAARDRQHHEQRQRQVALLDAVCGFYEQALRGDRGRVAREELRRRGVSDEMVARFRLGYAPDGWSNLSAWIERSTWSIDDAERVGLVARRKTGQGTYDRFRHRLMFPIRDAGGRVIAFSGRLLPSDEPDERSAKYINSPESPIYKKGEVLFGLYEGRTAVRSTGQAIVCEGNFDVLTLHQHGFAQALAPMGTALTEAQVQRLKRLCDRIALVFDGDQAGNKAARAAAPLVLKWALPTRWVVLPDGEDPDSFLRAKGPAAFERLMTHAPDLLDGIIDEAALRTEGSAAEKTRALHDLAPLLASVADPVETKLRMARVSERFGIGDPNLVRQVMRRALMTTRSSTDKEIRSPRTPSHDWRRWPTLEREAMGVLLDQPTLLMSDTATQVRTLLTEGSLRSILNIAVQQMQQRQGLVPTEMLQACDETMVDWLQRRMAVTKYLTECDGAHALHVVTVRLEMDQISSELKRVSQGITAALRSGDEERASELRSEHVRLSKRAYEVQSRLATVGTSVTKPSQAGGPSTQGITGVEG